MVDNPHPNTGERMPDFALPGLNGEMFDTSTFREVWNVAYFFTGYDDLPARELLGEVIGRQIDFTAEDAQVVIVAPSDNQSLISDLRLASHEMPFHILLDEGSKVHQQMQAVNLYGKPALTAFITDRFGEIFAAIRPNDPVWPPSAEALLDWLRFVEIQCPE